MSNPQTAENENHAQWTRNDLTAAPFIAFHCRICVFGGWTSKRQP